MIRKILYKVGIVILLPLSIIGITNYTIDVDYLLRDNYIPSVVNALVQGKIMAGPVNTHTRILKKQWIQELPYTPQVLILGSSRTINLRAESFSGKSFYNASVTNCTLNDMASFLWLFKQKGSLPEYIIINIDQWMLNPDFTEKEWIDLIDECEKMYTCLEIPFDNPLGYQWKRKKEKILPLFSAQYFLRCLKERNKKEYFTISDTLLPERMMYFPDGSRRIPLSVTDIPESEIHNKAVSYFYSSKEEQYTNLSIEKVNLLEKLIQYFSSEGCKIILYIPPYHPDLYALYEQSTSAAGVFKTEQWVRLKADQQNIRVWGASNPELLYLEGPDFYDGVHLKDFTLNHLVNTMPLR